MTRWKVAALSWVAVPVLFGGCSTSLQSSTDTASTTAPSRVATTLSTTTSPPAETWASATTVPERFAGLALGQAGCAPPSPIVQSEIRGTTSDGIELYALLIAKGPVIRAHDEVKIVWRISAGGPLVSATSPLGTPAKVTFGPEPHGGNEWGIGYVFDEPGCWHLQFRSDNRAHIWLVIEP